MKKILMLVVLILSLFALDGCGCKQSSYQEQPPPNGQYVVIEKETNCGATDPFGTAISIQAQQPYLGVMWLGFPRKRVFLADVSLSATRVKWLDNRNLEIVCTDCKKYGVVEKVRGWRDIKIHFDVGIEGRGDF